MEATRRVYRAPIEMLTSPAPDRSFGVGRHRIVYRVAARRLIELVALGPRRSICEDTFRLLRRERGH
jgi:hypothetical protein